MATVSVISVLQFDCNYVIVSENVNSFMNFMYYTFVTTSLSFVFECVVCMKV
jgi:hypothetical protein